MNHRGTEKTEDRKKNKERPPEARVPGGLRCISLLLVFCLLCALCASVVHLLPQCLLTSSGKYLSTDAIGLAATWPRPQIDVKSIVDESSGIRSSSCRPALPSSNAAMM